MTPRRQAPAVVTILAAVVLAGCGSTASTRSDPSPPLAGATSVAGIALASAPMGDLAAPANTFWELFARERGDWVLVTPPGVATNGGVLGAVVTPTSVTAAVVPSANLRFSPVANTADSGQSWSTGVLPGGIAPFPDALAASSSGRRLALLTSGGGTVATSVRGLSTWSTLADASRIATATASSGCRLATLRGVAFGPDGSVVVGGRCAHGSSVPVAVLRHGTWHVGAPSTLGVDATVLRLTGLPQGVATILETRWRGGRAVVAAVSPDGLGAWTLSSHLALAHGDTVASTSQGAEGAALVVVQSTDGARVAYAVGPRGRGWARLPRLPTGVADVVAGPGGSFQALAVDGSTLVVFDASRHGWRVAQRLGVPLASGSSR